jgi:5-methylcytosine-specific restriction endonuclease McrA
MESLKEFIDRAKLVMEGQVIASDEERKRKQRIRNDKRRERFLDACKNLSVEDWNDIYDFYENCPKGMHVDHIIPLCRGGLHHFSNLQYLTPMQNLKKGTKILELSIKPYDEDY